jgi:hypothetical protein
MAVMTAYPTELTEEVLAALGAPIPAHEIKQLPGGIRYTTDKWAKSRLDAVVGHAGWEDEYVITHLPKPVVMHEGLKDESLIIGAIVCKMSVLGVVKSDAVDIEITPKMFGTPITNAKARVFKRAARLYGVAEELWEKDAPATGGYATTSNQATVGSAKQAGGDVKLASPAQINWLTGKMFQVPNAVAAKLTGGREGQASAMIEELKIKSASDDYDEDSLMYIRQALEKIGRSDLVPLLKNSAATQPDEDQD